MKDMLIGTLTGISAVIAMALLMPKPQPPMLPVRELSSVDNQRFSDLGRTYLMSTESDPVRRKLEDTVARVNVNSMPLEKVVAYLAELTGQNFFVNWRELEAAGIDSHTVITLDLQNVPAAVVLKTALQEAGGDQVRLGYTIIDGVVQISTLDKLQQNAVTRIYNVRDLIEEEIAWNTKGDQGMTPTEAEDELVRLIEESIDPTSWRDAGGTVGGVGRFGGRLFVTQTPENQDVVLNLLAGLRRSNQPWPTTRTSTK